MPARPAPVRQRRRSPPAGGNRAARRLRAAPEVILPLPALALPSPAPSREERWEGTIYPAAYRRGRLCEESAAALRRPFAGRARRGARTCPSCPPAGGAKGGSRAPRSSLRGKRQPRLPWAYGLRGRPGNGRDRVAPGNAFARWSGQGVEEEGCRLWNTCLKSGPGCGLTLSEVRYLGSRLSWHREAGSGSSASTEALR